MSRIYEKESKMKTGRKRTILVQLEKEGTTHILKQAEGFIEAKTQCGIMHKLFKDDHYLKLWKIAEIDKELMNDYYRECYKEHVKEKVEN